MSPPKTPVVSHEAKSRSQPNQATHITIAILLVVAAITSEAFLAKACKETTAKNVAPEQDSAR